MKTMWTLLLMTVTALGDLNAWNNSTNAEISVAAITLGGVRNTSWPAQTNVAAANPTATVATTAVNGSATTFMRSDASPAIPASFIQANQTNVAAANPTATVSTSAVNGNAATFMRSDASPAIPASFIQGNQTNVAAANPSATISGSAQNGSAATFMRSDAAPALSTVGTAGTYRSVTTDANGRVTAGTTPTTFSGYGISDTSANLAAALTDETGTGVAVFGTSPTFTDTITVTNTASANRPLTINGFSGQTNDVARIGSGGTNYFRVASDGITSVKGGTASSPGLTFGPDSFTTTGFYATGTSTLVFTGNGSARVQWASTVSSIRSDAYYAWSSTTDPTATTDTFLARDGAAAVQLGQDAASPVSQTLKACDGSGTDKAGGNLTLEGGQSTGTGTAGLLDISTALTGEASGSTVNAYSIRAHYKPKFVALTHTTATSVETFSLAANKLIGGTITALCYATNSTPHLQALTSTIIFQAVAVSTTITGTISQVDGTTAADSGTLTCTYTLVDNGDNTFTIKANANSSLSSPTERCKLVVTALNGNAAITITDP